MGVTGEGDGDGDGTGWALRLVGPLTVVRHGRDLAPGDVGSRKARSLLAMLAVHRPAALPADRLVAALWPDRPPRNPEDNVATLVSRLRAVLGPAAVAGGRAGYRLGPLLGGAIDLDDAARLVRTARERAAAGEPALALAAARRAAELLDTGEVLAGEPDADWLQPARRAAERLLRTARQAAAEAALELGDPAAAVPPARAAVDADPLDEAAARLLMRAHRAAGEPARALAEFARLRRELAAELGTDPAAETRALHAELLTGAAPPAARDAGPAAPGRVSSSAPPAGRVPGEGLVGREEELARLAGAWSAAVAGRPGVVLVTGVGGIGKTRLAEELAALAAGTGGRVLRARCYRTERSLLLQPLADALRPLATGLPPPVLGELAGGDPAVLAALAAVVSDVDGALGPDPADRPAGPAGPERRHVFAGLAGFLRRLAGRGPVLLLLDDLHEAGLATADFVDHLARHARDAPLLVVATVRTDEGGPVLDRLGEVAVLLPVEPLSAAAVGRLAADAGRPELADRLFRLTRGHPLSAVETLRAVRAGETGVPGSLRDAVLSRVGRLGGPVGELLRAASVLGPPFEPATLAGVLDLPAPEAARRCERALRAGLLAVAGSAYEFANDLVQEVLSATIPAPTRVHYHRQAADLLADRPEAAAPHAAAAGQPVRAARAWLLAAEQALRRWAAADAERLVDRALAALSTVDDGTAELAGRAHLVRGRAREARAAYEAAWADHEAAAELARAAGDPRLEMAALRELAGDVLVGLGRPTAECEPWLAAGVRIARSLGDRASEADLLARHAVVASNRLRFAEAVRHGLAAVAAGRAARDERALAAALDGLKTAYAYSGDVAALTPVLAELEPLLRRQGDLWRLQWTLLESAFPAAAAGRWADAEERVEAARAVARRSSYASYDAWFVVHRGWLRRLQGDAGGALAAGREAVEVAAAQGGHPWWSAAAHAFLGGTLLAAGDRPAAVPELTAAVRHAERSHAEAHLLRGLAPLAEATGDRDQLERATRLLAAVTAPSGAWLLGADAYLAVARGWLAAGEPERAAAVLAPLTTAAARTGWLPLRTLATDLAADIAAARPAPTGR